MVQVVGHRGARLLAPENTLPGFEKAIELGCDWTECDIRQTADGHLVLMHDDTVDRTTDGTGRVADLTLAEVRALNAGDGAPVPTLDEVLELVEGRIGLVCELKGEDTAAPAVEKVRERGMIDQVVFTCFEFDRLAETRRLGPDPRLGGILSWPDVPGLERLLRLQAEVVSVHHGTLTPSYVRYAQDAGLQVRAWNPNGEDEIRRVLAMQPNGISSDRPDLVLAIIRGEL